MTNQLNPLHALLIKSNPEFVEDLRHDLSRRTGRTTAQALKFIAKAIENPYKKVHIVDHHNTTAKQCSPADRMNWELCLAIIAALDLKCMEFGVDISRGFYWISFGKVTE